MGQDATPTRDNHGFLVSKKLAGILALLFIGICVAIGLLVFYIGVSSECQHKKVPPVLPDTDQPVSSKYVQDVLLPSHLKPHKYKVDLIPFIIPGNFTISGQMSLEMSCLQSARNVTLHSLDIEIDEGSVTIWNMNNSKKVPIVRHSYDLEREFYVAHLSQDLIAGQNYSISMKFTAHLRDNLKGFYKSVVKNKQTNQEEYIAVTQFQATDARRAFPCMDEPALKATFEVRLGRMKNMSSISNMPIRPKGQGLPMSQSSLYVWDHYEESVPMSTYLVAFVVSSFSYQVAPDTGNQVIFRVWAKNDSADQLGYALDVGPRILHFFEKYFDVPYPLPKQDMIAIPDFSAGAMENWGLITFRETAMLYKEGESSLANKERVAYIISHELAHQWFGNLVTPSWWTDLWLNEGFASYVEYLGVDEVQPEFRMMEKFVISDLQNVMQIDALKSSHPISINVNNPAEIGEIFDRISYSKGASIIRMMDHFLTTESFRRGLSSYLKAFSYKAANQNDLWHHLTVQAHKDGKLPKEMTVHDIMDTWTLQTGFPVVTVYRNYADQTANVSQSRFFVKGPTQSKEMWWVPITFVAPGGDFSKTYNTEWLSNKQKSKVIGQLPPQDQAVIFNVKQTGYYRVNYDDKNWQLTITALRNQHTTIDAINRAQLIDDAMNLARAGYVDYEVAFGLTSYLHRETEYLPWNAALDNLEYVSKMLTRTEAYGVFRRYVRSLVDPLLDRIGFDSRASGLPFDIQLRKLALSWACSMKSTKCITFVKAQFAAWKSTPNPDQKGANPIHPDVRSIVYCFAIANGDDEDWDFVWNRYLNSPVAGEKQSLLDSLACSDEVWILNRLMNWTITEGSNIRRADGMGVIAKISSNTIGRDLAFDFIRDRWNDVMSHYQEVTFAFRRVSSVLKDRNTAQELKEIQKFQKDHQSDLEAFKREISQEIESGQANIEWMQSNYQVILNWLNKNSPESQSQ